MFFFFKQKTAYEMRISDWSSDVCSSDVGQAHYGRSDCAGRGLIAGDEKLIEGRQEFRDAQRSSVDFLGDQIRNHVVARICPAIGKDLNEVMLHFDCTFGAFDFSLVRQKQAERGNRRIRSEERRGGKECVSTG